MSETTQKAQHFLDARLVGARLISEQASTPSVRPGEVPEQFQAHAETNATFQIGVNDIGNPTELTIKLNYTVRLRILKSDISAGQYESEHAAKFKIIRATEAVNWADLQSDAVAPYLALVNVLAAKRCESTFHAMGLRGIAIPLVTDFGQSTAQPPQPEQVRRRSAAAGGTKKATGKRKSR